MTKTDLCTLFARGPVFFDGGMGTMLQARGLAPGMGAENWTMSHPQIVRQIHLDYLEAGAQIIKTNTLGANPLHYPHFDEIIRCGIGLAKEAVERSGRPALVAYDAGPLGRMLRPLGPLDPDEAYGSYADMMTCAEGAGADLILIETQTDLAEMREALRAARAATRLPVMVTATFDNTGRMLCGTPPEVSAVVAGSLGAVAVGANCGTGASDMIPLLARMRRATPLPLISNPNAGLPQTVEGRLLYPEGPDLFGARGPSLIAAGASAVGGCCGTTPDCIRVLVDACRGVSPPTASSAPVMLASDRVVFDAALVTRSAVTWVDEVRGALLNDDADTAADALSDAAEDEPSLMGLNLCGAAGHEAALGALLSQITYMIHTPLCVTADDAAMLRAFLRGYVGRAGVFGCSAAHEAECRAVCREWGAVWLS